MKHVIATLLLPTGIIQVTDVTICDNKMILKEEWDPCNKIMDSLPSSKKYTLNVEGVNATTLAAAMQVFVQGTSFDTESLDMLQELLTTGIKTVIGNVITLNDGRLVTKDLYPTFSLKTICDENTPADVRELVQWAMSSENMGGVYRDAYNNRLRIDGHYDYVPVGLRPAWDKLDTGMTLFLDVLNTINVDVKLTVPLRTHVDTILNDRLLNGRYEITYEDDTVVYVKCNDTDKDAFIRLRFRERDDTSSYRLPHPGARPWESATVNSSGNVTKILSVDYIPVETAKGAIAELIAEVSE